MFIYEFYIWISYAFVCIYWQPNLYTLVVILKDASGNVVDCESCLVGMRQVSKAHKQLLVNGHPVIIRGVNRHEHHPRVGKTNIESCMVKVTYSNVLLAIISACHVDFSDYDDSPGLGMLKTFMTIPLAGFGYNEAKQYQCCEKQSLSSTSPLVRVV
jgi:hypothetical protein